MLSTRHERPRELKWYHAGSLLYGDWGTSRFYVLGLAFYYALYSSFWYILGVGILVAAVGWAYTVVCRAYPDGGGVYSAARQVSPVLGVIGALLLFANYAVTAALSAMEGIHYFGVESATWVAVGAIASILFLGLINAIGPRHASKFAVVVAAATLLLTAVLFLFAIPHLGAGIRMMDTVHESYSVRWTTLVNVVLALSGVEAIANMTGIMVKPVKSTAKKAIWPVLIEVVIFNLIFGIAMLALPAILQQNGKATAADFREPAAHYDQAREHFAKTHAGYETNPILKEQYDNLPNKTAVEERTQKVVMRVMGEEYVGRWFGILAGFVFGLLLLSAVNTVIGGMISVSYVMARDRELPRIFARLNIFGVPWWGLLPALGVPVILLLLFRDLHLLADLYAIGVVGAIAINLTSCTINKGLEIRTVERVFIGVIAAVMIAIEATLAFTKPHALIFVLIILSVGLLARLFTKWYLPRARKRPKPATAETPVEVGIPVEAPAIALEQFATPAEQLDMAKPHVLVAARGSKRLIDFAVNYTKQIGGILFVIYVRQLNVAFGPERAPTFDEDRQAQDTFKTAFETAKAQGVQMVPIYVVSPDVADAILDFAATYNVSALLMGVSRTGAVLRALRGDVLTAVADHLPQDIPLLIHA